MTESLSPERAAQGRDPNPDDPKMSPAPDTPKASARGERLDGQVLDQLFLEARTHYAWTDRAVAPELLREVVHLTEMGPTSANCSPLRIVFVTSPEARERLRPHLSPGNVEKTMSAPVTAILGYDTLFYEKLPILFPHADARSWFIGKPAYAEATAFRNSSLQGAYLIMAARSLGLDVGPMSGFDAAGIAAAFFPGGQVKANFLCNLGYGDTNKLFPRSPRFAFDIVASLV